MKTEEDEAFDDLAKKQGSWGGGFPAKRAMAADKLQEPAQEPVAWICSAFGDDEVEYGTHQECENCVPLYTHPPQRTEQEPVAWRWGNKKLNGGYEWRYTTYKTQPDAIPLYTTPPQTAQKPMECLDCGSHNVGIPATYDSLINSVKALNT